MITAFASISMYNFLILRLFAKIRPSRRPKSSAAIEWVMPMFLVLHYLDLFVEIVGGSFLFLWDRKWTPRVVWASCYISLDLILGLRASCDTTPLLHPFQPFFFWVCMRAWVCFGCVHLNWGVLSLLAKVLGLDMQTLTQYVCLPITSRKPLKEHSERSVETSNNIVQYCSCNIHF